MAITKPPSVVISNALDGREIFDIEVCLTLEASRLSWLFDNIDMLSGLHWNRQFEAWLAGSSWVRTTKPYAFGTRKPRRALRIFEGYEAHVTSVAVMPDGKVVSGSWDRTLRLLDAANSQQIC